MRRQTVENVKTLLTSFLTGFEKKKAFYIWLAAHSFCYAVQFSCIAQHIAF